MSVRIGISKSTRRGITTYEACNRHGVCARFSTLREARTFSKGDDKS